MASHCSRNISCIFSRKVIFLLLPPVDPRVTKMHAYMLKQFYLHEKVKRPSLVDLFFVVVDPLYVRTAGK